MRARFRASADRTDVVALFEYRERISEEQVEGVAFWVMALREVDQ
jgi:hypothetical protein